MEEDWMFLACIQVGTLDLELRFRYVVSNPCLMTTKLGTPIPCPERSEDLLFKSWGVGVDGEQMGHRS